MARAPNEKAADALHMYRKGYKLVDIAKELNLPASTIRRWKSSYKWDTEHSDNQNERSHKHRGGQPGNKNALGDGAPLKNKNAEKHGFFSKYLPEETFAIVEEIEKKNPIDILWENIQIAYAAIVRAQSIMYVADKDDKTIEKVGESQGKVISEKWEVQQAWDKQANFLKAQARAQSELRSLIKQYDEMLHKNWDDVTEEQKARIAVLKAKANLDDGIQEDDGFLDAVSGKAGDVWQE